MNEFNFLKDILHPKYLADDQTLMVEDKDCDHHAAHTVKIVKTKPITDMSLYRFSLDDEDFLPFFTDSRNKVIPGPKGLKKFCDYIILVEKDDKLIIVLVEMKRSKKDPDYKNQLDASQLFMEYVIKSAVRIMNMNGNDDFDERNIVFRKVKIRKPKSNKFITKPRQKAIDSRLEEYISLDVNQFNPVWIF